MDPFEDVRQFHIKYGLPTPARPELLARDVFDYRLNFLKEEIQEFEEAHQRGDVAECLDGLVDLVYVALGTAIMMGLPFNPGWAEVQRANMQKKRVANGEQSKRGHAFDVIKPEGWVPPDHRPALAACYLGRPTNVDAFRKLFALPIEQQKEIMSVAGITVDPWHLGHALELAREIRKIDGVIAAVYKLSAAA